MVPIWPLRLVQGVSSVILRSASVPALIALIAIGLLGLLADHQNTQIFRQQVRSRTADELSVIRARLEGNISRDIQIGRGVAAALSSRPSMGQAEYTGFVDRLLETGSDLRSIAAAPDMVVRMVHPLLGNEKAVGLDYARTPSQRDAAFRVKETGQLVLAGPLALVQGGVGLLARFPVFADSSGSPRAFWGIVSAVIDVDKLYANSGIVAPESRLDLAMRGRDGKGADGEFFFGDNGLMSLDPVLASLQVPGGTWEMAAIPKGGWPTSAPNAVLFRLMIAFIGMVVVLPILISGHLYSDRRRHLNELGRRRTEIERLSSRFELALETSAIGVWEFDIASRRLTWDDRMYELYGVSPDGAPLSDANWRACLHPDERQRAVNDFEQSLHAGGRYMSTFRVALPGGDTRVIRAVGSVLQESSGGVVLGLNWDVTDDIRLHDELRTANSLADARNTQLEAANRRIEHASLHDALTALPNRRYLTDYLDRLEKGLPFAGDDPIDGDRVAVLHIDLDRFKQVNDTFGHAIGDKLLLAAADLMRQVFRQGDLVARIGGDEFVAVCVGDQPDKLARRLASNLIAGFNHPIDLGEIKCRSGVSVGIACARLGEVNLAKLLINADIALYRAKELGRNRYEFFTTTLEAEVVSAKKIADDILTGIEERQFLAHYQPQYDAMTRQLVGLEALVRWQHPTEGLIAPPRFLKTAETINALPILDHIVLEAALADRRRWVAAGLHVPRIAVNVSANRLRDERLIETLLATAVEPGTLSFELTEAIYLDDTDKIMSSNIQRLKDLGVEIDIDDFGTGYASIISLTRLQPTRLKIAHQLTSAVTTSLPQRQLVRSIVEIGQALGIGIVAEGVETMEQADILGDLGCDILQGYAFSWPVAADEIVRVAGVRHRPAGDSESGSDSALFSARL